MDDATKGWLNGLVGTAIFSASLPATKAAVAAFDPLFLASARGAIAGAVGLAALAAFGQKRPARGDVPALIVVALGVVIGFPLLTALALRTITSAHSLVFIGLLPMTTALFGALRAGERPRSAFWFFSSVGAVCVTGFAFSRGISAVSAGDLLMLAAIIVCGLGYAEGGRLSRKLGGWQVISWALALALPITLGAAIAVLPPSFQGVPPSAWLGLFYVTLFSMLIGFVFWYRGLALGGIAAVGQLQLLQPFLGLFLAALLLGEEVGALALVTTAAVVVCVAGAKRYA